jgi:polar amino acid transport system substrate-binding protein
MLSVVLFLCPMPGHTADPPVLEWCLDHYPQRHAYPKDAEPYGPTVDLMRELAVRAGFILKFSPDTPFARCLKQMETGKTDLMINLNFSEQRAKFMHMLPYSKGVPEMLYLRASQQGIPNFIHLQHQPIALVRGYVYADKLLGAISFQQLTVHEADTLENAFGLLLRKRVDAVVAPQQQASSIMANQPLFQGQFQKIPLEDEMVTTLYAHVGFSKKSAHSQLLPAIREALQQLVDEGKIHHLPAAEPMTTNVNPATPF